MQLKILSKIAVLIIIIIGSAVYPTLLFYFTNKSVAQNQSLLFINNAVAAPKQKQKNYNLPIRLKIPKIKVNAAIESIGLTPKGEVGIPTGPANTAWFKLSPLPGANGNSIITGHYGYWKNNKPTVFNNLSKLRKGDKIYIENGKGEITTFIVRESKSYNPKATATDVFISTDGKSHLNLITCEGVWDKVAKNYSNRLVVFADKE